MANRKVTKDVSDSVIAAAVLASFPLNKTDRILEAHATDHAEVVVKGSNLIPMRIGDNWFLIDTDTNVDTTSDIDTGAIEAGKDYCVYACDNAGSLVFKISLATTFPSGFDANSSRKIGGFHTLCVSVGTISGHTLTGYLAGEILPLSVWDLKHRPVAEPAGMVYSPGANVWVDIYLTSGTGVSTASVNGGTISDTRTWLDFVDDYADVKKSMLDDIEFQVIAAGSNEETNIAGSADPVTTGGHTDTAGRRMVSKIGCEDCCGVMWQWLRDQSFRCDPDGTVGVAGLTFTVAYAASPGGNPIYLRQSSGGRYYLACNMASAAADKYIGPTNYKIPIKHEADPATGAIGQVYFDDDAAQPGRLLCNISAVGKNVFIPTNNPSYFLQVTHSATASSLGTALYYDDGADNRLESANASAANQSLDLALNSQAFGWSDLPGSKGSLYRQGTYGDVKLRAGANWGAGAIAGSRARDANSYRWGSGSYFGGRGRSEPR